MIRQSIIDRTIQAMSRLPEDKAVEISDFADFVIKRYEDHQLTQCIQEAASQSRAFDFLTNEEDLYSPADLKEVYNG
jgi:hypothetical protein